MPKKTCYENMALDYVAEVQKCCTFKINGNNVVIKEHYLLL